MRGRCLHPPPGAAGAGGWRRCRPAEVRAEAGRRGGRLRGRGGRREGRGVQVSGCCGLGGGFSRVLPCCS